MWIWSWRMSRSRLLEMRREVENTRMQRRLRKARRRSEELRRGFLIVKWLNQRRPLKCQVRHHIFKLMLLLSWLPE